MRNWLDRKIREKMRLRWVALYLLVMMPIGGAIGGYLGDHSLRWLLLGLGTGLLLGAWQAFALYRWGDRKRYRW